MNERKNTTQPTLNERLRSAGCTTSPAGNGKKYIFFMGLLVFTGNAYEVSDWLDKNSDDFYRDAT